MDHLHYSRKVDNGSRGNDHVLHILPGEDDAQDGRVNGGVGDCGMWRVPTYHVGGEGNKGRVGDVQGLRVYSYLHPADRMWRGEERLRQGERGYDSPAEGVRSDRGVNDRSLCGCQWQNKVFSVADGIQVYILTRPHTRGRRHHPQKNKSQYGHCDRVGRCVTGDWWVDVRVDATCNA